MSGSGSTSGSTSELADAIKQLTRIAVATEKREQEKKAPKIPIAKPAQFTGERRHAKDWIEQLETHFENDPNIKEPWKIQVALSYCQGAERAINFAKNIKCQTRGLRDYPAMDKVPSSVVLGRCISRNAKYTRILS